MKKKKLLCFALALSLLISALSPAATAYAQPESESISTEQSKQEEKNTKTSTWLNDRVLSQGKDEVKEDSDLRTLRDDQDDVVTSDVTGKADPVVNSNGQWTATESETEISVSLKDTELPACVQELRDAAEYYSSTDRVSAFVVLERAPFVEYYGSINEVPADAAAQAEMWQEAVVTLIEEDVLGGEELTVVAQFNYLTNAIVVETEFANLESIAYVEGVETVFISPIFYPCETETVVYPETISSNQMTGVSSVWNNADLGYTGEGMTIAILDTGLDLDHPSFAAEPANAAWDTAYLESVVSTLNAAELYTESTGKTLTASDLYYSAKVPFTFNYAMGNTNVSHTDGLGDHGTHVAGIAAANNVENSGVSGMAPDAQIVVMKVFNSSTGGASMYDILNALEDALRLGCDVANMSLGSASGFSKSGAVVIDQIFESISSTDMIVDVAAGNEGTSSYGSLWGTYQNTTDNIENATISSPSTYANSMSVASVNNKKVPAVYFSLADGTKVFYMQSVEYLYGYIEFSMEVLVDNGTMEYVIVPNLGAVEDFYDEEGNSIVEGKVAVISRGVTSFSEKIFNAQNAGAVAALIWDNVSEDIFSFGMSTEGEAGYPSIPVGLISLEDGQKMADAETKTMIVSAEADYREDATGGQISSFSSWGVTPNLGLQPDIAGVGGNVYSCYDGGVYGLMSGTSMATPQVAGVTALVLQYLKENYDLSEAETRTLADGLMMSTAVPVIDNNTGYEASPRQQGAGLVNALYSVTSEAYLSVDGNERPKAELGDSEAGSYSFTFTVHNFGSTEKTYNLSSSLLCEDYVEYTDMYPGVYFMAGTEHALDNSAVSFSQSSVTVPANGTAAVTVTINLTQADKEWIDTYFANGNYVEGFVYLTNAAEDGVDLSLPFLGFYGDWTDAPIFDTGYWYENSFWGLPADEVEANQYYHIPWTSLGSGESDWVLGFSPYTGALEDENGDIIYSSDNNVISPNGDGVLDQISDYYLSLMRNARWVNLTYTDADGNVLDEEKLDYISRTMYNSNYGATVPFIYSWYYDSLYDFTDADGNYLADGTELTLTISGELDYGEEGVVTDSFQIPIHIDTVAPTIVGNPVESSDEENGVNYLTLTISDAHLAYVALMNTAGTQIYNTYADADFVKNDDGTYTVKMDVTDLGDTFMVAVCDYGCNEAYYDLEYSIDNNPEMDDSLLYAYRIYDEYLYYYYGWDYMFGWTSIDKETAEATALSSDAYEYYALTAAEYAGGYIFAVDAGYNFIYMVPGLWNRNMICNLGVNVVDMAFDEVTQTMYMTTKTESDYGALCSLYTVDLLTGDLTLLKEYSSVYGMPWAMTFVDGELYACKYYYNGLYKVDLEGETYDLTAVTDADGNSISFVLSTGRNANPYYSQSMTYSKADGVIYWAYYGYNGYELIVINPADWTYKTIPFGWDQEYVGVLTLEDDGYTLPESTEVTKLTISDKQLIMTEGETAVLTAGALPWNAPVAEIIWSSDDESIAAVDADGVVTAVSEGNAVITATCGDLSASCRVVVVKISGNVYAYNYYSGDGNYGTWLDIDLAGMTAEYLDASPVDFIAADYNGHDGNIYGFDAFGQCYRYNPETGECVALGAAGTKVPADMAYDYSSGLMYVAVYDYMTWTTTLYYLNMNTGALVEAAVAYDVYLTLACDMYGYLYAINAYGQLFLLTLYEGGAAGGGIMPWSEDGSSSMYVDAAFLMQTPVTELAYAQSMCYDHVNDVILWTTPEYSTIYWLDIWADTPYAIDLGEPTGSGLVEFVGMYVVPEEIPELAYAPVESLEAEDMMVLVGGSKIPAVSIDPLNATNQDITYVSSDESIVKIENGMVVGVSLGSAVVTATLVDTDEEGNETTYTCTFNVSVKKSTDNIYGYLMQDIVNYNGYTWINIPDTDPNNYSQIDYVYYNGVNMTLYSAEYVDGYIYAYGYDDTDWSASFQYLTIDAKTWSVVSAVDMGDEFPFVYDMAYDYTTGTMYALAGTSTSTNLYMVNMANGSLIECLLTEPMFMSIAVDEDGTIYAMANSEEEFDWDTWSTTYGNAYLYTIDVETGTYELLMDTGVGCNMLASMAYDYDTGYLYWTGFFNPGTGSYISGLYLIDVEELACYNLGTIGAGGSQVSGLMIFADEYPEIPDTLQKVAITSTQEEVAVGGTVALETFLQPSNLEVEMVWSSEDESIAVVDENGVVTGVSAGTTTITVTVSDGEKTLTAEVTIVVYGVEDYFLTYNWTDGGFSSIGRPDSTVVGNLTEGEEEPYVRSMAMVDGVVYAYDVDNNLFTTSAADDYVRNYIGNANIEVAESELVTEGDSSTYNEYTFTVRDMAWDEVGGRMLALGSLGVNQTYTYDDGDYYYSYEEKYELNSGCRLYEVDLETGALTELCVVGGESFETGVYMLTVTDSGEVYIYSSFMDWVSELNPETGEVTYISTLQNQGVYGSSDGEPMAMAYDSLTGNIYMLFTSNGNFYQMYKFNPGTGALSRVGDVGVVEYYSGDAFAGLAVNKHIHVYTSEVVDPTCTEAGATVYTCSCGDSYSEEIPATGHSYGEWEMTVVPGCETTGLQIHTCETCGHAESEEIPATGHNSECGHGYVEPDTGSEDNGNGSGSASEGADTGDPFNAIGWIVVMIVSAGAVVLLVNKKKLFGNIAE